ncbi:uncharacterized protein LOC119112016, partial [Pollicipes pollicipes]|uniref:uncharacterized protein LOC119112016 n=1 Tax=Pollicipes pollicipes TaxID=41117 RepID=UPI0018851B64
MHERSIDDDHASGREVLEPLRPERHYDLVVRPTTEAGDDPACDCAGPPPPQFLLPPPPVDPSWAAGDADVCDIVAPYQICRGLAGSAESGSGGSTALPILAVILTASGLLLVVLLAVTLFFCRYRRRMRALMSNKSSGKRSDTSRMLYDGLPVQTQVLPNNLRSNGQTPHIEMVAVKGQCRQLAAGRPPGAGALFVYPPPPSLTDDGSERTSNMYEEIPYYGHPAPSVSYCSDSDEEELSRPSDDDRRPHPYIPVGSDDGGDARYVRTL